LCARLCGEALASPRGQVLGSWGVLIGALPQVRRVLGCL
jgi:hypothetical protein